MASSVISKTPQQISPADSVPKNLSRTPKTTSLKSLVKEPETTVQAINEQTSQSTPFTEDDLIKCWDAYTETIEEKVHLKNTMLNCKPVLSDHFKFEVRVHNSAQKEVLLNNSLNLLKILRTQLKNDLIQITIHVDENMEKKAIYTSTEKFEFLNNINPLLTKLIDELELVLD